MPRGSRASRGTTRRRSSCPARARGTWQVDPAPFPAFELEPVEVEPGDTATASTLLLRKWSTSGTTLHAVDAATGEAVHEPLDFDHIYAHAYAPNHGTLAFFEGSSAWHTLQLLDLDTWQPVKTALKSYGVLPSSTLAWRADGTQLAATMRVVEAALGAEWSNRLALVDTADGSILHEVEIDFAPRAMHFTADGQSLAVYGTAYDAYALDEETLPAPPTVALFDAQTLAPQWSTALDGIVHGAWCAERCETPHEFTGVDDAPRGHYWTPAVVFAPDASALYVVHADEEKLTTVDLTNRRVHTQDIRPSQNWIETLIERVLSLLARTAKAKVPFDGAERRAVLSPDGTRLYVSGTRYTIGEEEGQPRVQSTPLGVQLIDPATGHLLAQPEQSTSAPTLTPDGQHLLASIRDEADESHTLLLDAQTLEEVARVAGRLTLAPQPNGEALLLTIARPGIESTVQVLDGETLSPLHEWSMSGPRWRRNEAVASSLLAQTPPTIQ